MEEPRRGARCTVYVPGLGTIDGRTRPAKVYSQTVEELLADLGGEEECTHAELELVRRAAGLSVLAGLAEAKMVAHQDIDVGELVSVGNAQRRILVTLGLRRRARAVNPSQPGELERILSPEEYEEYVGPANPAHARRRTR